MSHSHAHAANYDRAFAIGIVLNVLFMLVGAFLCRVTEALHERFGIEHATIQIEANSELCALTDHV